MDLDYELLYEVARGLHENHIVWHPNDGLQAAPHDPDPLYWGSITRRAQADAWLARLFSAALVPVEGGAGPPGAA